MCSSLSHATIHKRAQGTNWVLPKKGDGPRLAEVAGGLACFGAGDPASLVRRPPRVPLWAIDSSASLFGWGDLPPRPSCNIRQTRVHERIETTIRLCRTGRTRARLPIRKRIYELFVEHRRIGTVARVMNAEGARCTVAPQRSRIVLSWAISRSDIKDRFRSSLRTTLRDAQTPPGLPSLVELPSRGCLSTLLSGSRRT